MGGIVNLYQDKERIYDKNECITFLKTHEDFGGLSNMAAGYPIYVNKILIKTTEALYQACRFPHLPDVQSTIINQNSPMTAKMKSKLFKSKTRDDWDEVKVLIMKYCLRVKLIYNWHTFGVLLESTKNLQIVEESKKDSFWGAKPIDEKYLKGFNVLGRLLMETRTIYKCINDKGITNLHINPINIQDFLLYGKPIEQIYASIILNKSGSLDFSKQEIFTNISNGKH